jgi:hypothetical protein
MRKLVILAPKSASIASIFDSNICTNFDDMPPLLLHVFIIFENV